MDETVDVDEDADDDDADADADADDDDDDDADDTSALAPTSKASTCGALGTSWTLVDDVPR